MQHIFSDRAPVTGLKKTADGYLVGSVKCARVGTQVYTRKELQLDGNPDELVTVYRPPEAVFAEDSLRTYAGKPITINHPKESVGAENWKDLAVGTVGSKVLRDGEFVVVDFSLMDAAAIAAVESGTREVSMGYRTPMELRDGVTPDGVPYQAVQTGPIVINHLAVVPAARGGKELRIGDAANNWGASPAQNEETAMSTKTVVLGDSAVTVPLVDAAAIETFKNTMTKALKDAEAKLEEKEEELGKVKAEKKKLEGEVLTDAQISKLVADRVALETQVKLLDASIECEAVSDADLRKAAVIAKLGDEAVADASPAEVTGMFKALIVAQDAAKNDNMRKVLTGQSRFTDGGPEAWNDKVASMAGVKFKKEA